MRRALLASILLPLLSLCVIAGNSGQAGRPIPPGIREADKQTNAPIEGPSQPPKRKNVEPAKLKQEAQELAELSAAIPSQIEEVNRGQLPKDLGDRLKRIEKLVRELRGQVSP